MPRRRIRRPLYWLALLGVSMAVVAYVLGVAFFQAWRDHHFHFTELILPRLIDVTVFAWLFWVGSAIGSFLNVVAWRMPRGESVNGRSYCPRCHTRLAARDNFPVFGWLALGGRCRTCHLPIAARYPIVEAMVGLCITLVGIAELYRLSLPLVDPTVVLGPLWAPRVSSPQLAVLAFHIVALSTSFACGLIRWDGHSLPGPLKWFIGIALTVPLLAIPSLGIVPWQVTMPAQWEWSHQYLHALLRLLCSAAGAIFFSRSLAKTLCPTADLKLDPLGSGTRRLIDCVFIVAIAAFVAGWQALPAILVLAVLVAVLVMRVNQRRSAAKPIDPFAAFAIAMPFALTFQLAFWRPLHHAIFWPSIDSPPWLILGASLLALLVPYLLLRSPRQSPADSRAAASFNAPDAGDDDAGDDDWDEEDER